MKTTGLFSKQNFIVVIPVLGLGILLTVLSISLREWELRRVFLEHAQFASQAVHEFDLQQLSGSQADLSSPVYAELKRLLVGVAALHPDYKFVYVLGQRPDKQVFFYADSEDETSRDYSPPGQLFPEASARLLQAFTDGSPVVEGPVTDRWGVWISALVPFKGGMLGIDLDSRVWWKDKVYAAITPIIFTLLVLALFLAYRSKYEYQLVRSNLESLRENLLESEQKYAFFIEHALEGVLSIDKTSRLNFVNPRLAEMLGYRPDEMIGRQVDEFIVLDEQADHHQRVAERAVGLSSQYERTLLRKDGSMINVLVSAVPMKNTKGAIIGSYAMLVDITGRKQAESALRESQERYRLFIDACDDLVFLKDHLLRYVIINKAYQYFLGRIEQEIIGKTDAELLPEENARNCRKSDEAAQHSDSIIILNEKFSGKAYEVRKFPVRFADGTVGVGGVIREARGGA